MCSYLPAVSKQAAGQMRPLTSLPALILAEGLLHRKALLVFVPPPTMSLNRVELQTASPVTHVSHSPHELPAQGLVWWPAVPASVSFCHHDSELEPRDSSYVGITALWPQMGLLAHLPPYLSLSGGSSYPHAGHDFFHVPRKAGLSPSVLHRALKYYNSY